jgi:hypothetical protein
MSLARDVAQVPRTAVNHLRLSLVGVLLQLIQSAENPAELGGEGVSADYLEECREITAAPLPGPAIWRAAVAAWAAPVPDLPLLRLERSGVPRLAIDLLLTLGFAEEDMRLPMLFDGGRRMTVGALLALWRDRDEAEGGVRAALGCLRERGLVEIGDEHKARLDWEVAVVPAIWDALSGATPRADGLVFTPLGDLPSAESFIPPAASVPTCAALAALLDRPEPPVLCLRGPAAGGRRRLAAAISGSLGRPLIALAAAPAAVDDQSWQTARALAAIAGAALLIELDLAPGETRELPPLGASEAPLFVLAGPTGGVRIADGRPVVTVALPFPDAGARLALWRRHAPDTPEPVLAAIAGAFRIPGGAVARAAAAAAEEARLAGRASIESDDVRRALRTIGDSRLETVARRVTHADAFLALDGEAEEEMAALAARCRHREALGIVHLGGIGSPYGVRALFAGPSGTGKTLAAQWLAARLGKELFRLDLAAAVSKYIGETEKNLDRAFAAAEELDCILLLDEGDSLMTRRTDVGSSNDRYANLETNFLLQRMECFDGILLVTTNAPDRIDEAFARRMDVVVPFRAPDEALRYEILVRHLGDHQASDLLLQEIACRCALTGGQLRNVALHARLLALEAGSAIGDGHLRAALTREYRKSDAHCPLKPQLAEVC